MGLSAVGDKPLLLHPSEGESLSFLIEASCVLLETTSLPKIQLPLLELAGRLISADAYAFCGRDPSNESGITAFGAGLSNSFYEEVSFSGDYVHQGQEDILAIENVRQPAWLNERQHAYRSEGIASCLIIPLRLHRKFKDTIIFYYRNPHLFHESEIRVATSFANLAQTAIRNAERFEEQRKLRTRAEEASHAKDEFIATASHELRTPLNAILGWASLLNHGRLDEVSARHAAEIIERNARSQSLIIEDLLEISRMITGKLRLEVRVTDLCPVLENALESIRPTAQAKKIELRSGFDPFTRPVSGDPERLQQIFWNLLSNAVKFTGEGGLIQIRLQGTGSHVEIAVQDNGIGIEKALLPHVFDRFRQADSPLVRAYGGMGMGLAIVRHLVELHGGTVHAESQGPGQGSTFVLRFPTAERPE